MFSDRTKVSDESLASVAGKLAPGTGAQDWLYVYVARFRPAGETSTAYQVIPKGGAPVHRAARVVSGRAVTVGRMSPSPSSITSTLAWAVVNVRVRLSMRTCSVGNVAVPPQVVVPRIG